MSRVRTCYLSPKRIVIRSILAVAMGQYSKYAQRHDYKNTNSVPLLPSHNPGHDLIPCTDMALRFQVALSERLVGATPGIAPKEFAFREYLRAKSEWDKIPHIHLPFFMPIT